MRIVISMKKSLSIKKSLESQNSKQEKYDLAKIQGIVESLDFLRNEAKTIGSEEIQTMIESSFNIVFSIYYLILRDQLGNEIHLVNKETH